MILKKLCEILGLLTSIIVGGENDVDNAGSVKRARAQGNGEVVSNGGPGRA